jgi:hypothetical protein
MPAAGLDRVGEEEVQVERADVRFVPDLGCRFGRAIVHLDGAVVARRVHGNRRRRRKQRDHDQGEHRQPCHRTPAGPATVRAPQEGHHLASNVTHRDMRRRSPDADAA